MKAKAVELRKVEPSLSDAEAFEKVFTSPANREIVQKYKAENPPNF